MNDTVLRLRSDIAVPAGTGVQDSLDTVYFRAPIDLLPGDELLVREATGELLAVRRQGAQVWQPAPDAIPAVSIGGKLESVDLDALRALFANGRDLLHMFAEGIVADATPPAPSPESPHPTPSDCRHP